MIVRLSEIEDGSVLKGSIDGLQLKGMECNDFSFLTPVNYEIVVRKCEDSARLEGSIRCTLSMMCSRCLESFACTVQAVLDVDLAKKSADYEAELEFVEEDPDVYYYDDDEMDITPLVCEEILLSIPMKPLCTENCKGLCSICGKNNNIEDCDCKKVSNTMLGAKLNAFLAPQGDNYGSSKKKNFPIKKGQKKNPL